MHGLRGQRRTDKAWLSCNQKVLVCSSERWPDYTRNRCRAVQYVPLFYRIQRPVLRTGLADRGSVSRLRNLLIDFNSACHELKRDQQALAGLHAAMQKQKLGGTPSREALLQLEVGLCSFIIQLMCGEARLAKQGQRGEAGSQPFKCKRTAARLVVSSDIPMGSCFPCPKYSFAICLLHCVDSQECTLVEVPALIENLSGARVSARSLQQA